MDLWQDIRYAARRLIDARWFTLAAVAALSLGIGANTTVFTLVNAVLLRGLPVENPERVMGVWTESVEGEGDGISLLDYIDVRDQSRTLESIAAQLGSSVNLSDDERLPEQVQGSYVTGNFFRMFGVQPILGRDFTDEDDLPGAEPVVLIGYEVWQNRFGGDPNILGTVLRVNSLVATVVGVMPEGVQLPFESNVWIPQQNLPPGSNTALRANRNLGAIGRLAPGVSEEQARQELRGIGQRLAEEYPDSNGEFVFDLMPFHEQVTQGEIAILFLTLMGSVAFVLLIACANVANLLLAKAAERGREIAVRVSLGATRSRIVRQLLAESVLLSVVAGVVGLGLSLFGISWFDGITANVGKPAWMVFSLDAIVFAYIAAVCLGAGMLFGLAPALHVSRTDVNEILKEGARGGTGGVRTRRWAGALIVGEMALTLVLLSGAGFMMRSFMAMYQMDLGVRTEGLVTMDVYLPLTKYPEPEPRAVLFQDFLDRLEGIPEVRSYTIASAMPMEGGGPMGLEVDGKVLEPGVTAPTVLTVSVSERYFETLEVELLRGRMFGRDDGLPGSEAAIVSQRFVELHLPDGDPVGRQIRLRPPVGPVPVPEGPEPPWITVIGVAPVIPQDIENTPGAEPLPTLYMPLRANPIRTPRLVVRTQGDPAAATMVVREAMRAVEPDIPFYNVRTMDERLALARWPFRTFGIMFSVFAGIALLLSAIGLYSITANSVIQRTREFGIRMSVGAEPHQISWLALRRVLIQLAIGLPIGIAGAFGVGQILESVLVQTTPGDPMTLVGTAAVMVTVAVLACLWPARRAARIDPVTALRTE